MKAKVIILAKPHLYIFLTLQLMQCCYHISLIRVFLNIKALKEKAFSIFVACCIAYTYIAHQRHPYMERLYQLSDIYMHLQNLFYSFVSKAPTHVASSCIVDCGENVLIFVTGVELLYSKPLK